MIILGINGIDGLFHDASATVVRDDEVVASVEEERFNRRKHSNGVPYHAIEYCLNRAGVGFADVDHIGYYLDPAALEATFVDKMVIAYGADRSRLEYYAEAARGIAGLPGTLAAAFSVSPRTQFHFLNHHLAHASSAYYISGFDRAAVLTIDGSGDRETSTLYVGKGGCLSKVNDFLVYPESLGYLYTVFAHHVGFDWISGPGKLMGLAAYGKADASLFDDVIVRRSDAKRPLSIDLSFFDYHLGGSGFTSKGLDRFGPPRSADEPLTQRQCDLAASVQAALERAIMHVVSRVKALLPAESNLCFAGGVALNVCTNRRIVDSGWFERLFVPPPASDAGASLGCALALAGRLRGKTGFKFDVYSGPDIRDFDIAAALHACGERIHATVLDEGELCERAARDLQANRIIGWVQGRMECGPRALGNRSFLSNPMNPSAKDDLNARVKKREAFRPYAASVLAEACQDWFDVASSPYMLVEADVRAEKRAIIPGVVHVDGTCRPQSVTRAQNPRYYRLIDRFGQHTGVPVVLNTSFNLHGEPIVNTPEDALAALFNTDLDALYIDNYRVTRRP